MPTINQCAITNDTVVRTLVFKVDGNHENFDNLAKSGQLFFLRIPMKNLLENMIVNFVLLSHFCISQ